MTAPHTFSSSLPRSISSGLQAPCCPLLAAAATSSSPRSISSGLWKFGSLWLRSRLYSNPKNDRSCTVCGFLRIEAGTASLLVLLPWSYADAVRTKLWGISLPVFSSMSCTFVKLQARLFSHATSTRGTGRGRRFRLSWSWKVHRMDNHSASYLRVASPVAGNSRICMKSLPGIGLSRAKNFVCRSCVPLLGCLTMAANFTCKCAANQCAGFSVCKMSSNAGFPSRPVSMSLRKNGFFCSSCSRFPWSCTLLGQSWERKMSTGCLICRRRKTSVCLTW
mmetsp:Transcript_4859/g.31067  ORF Transcript_4859/g.31067 Transcript_4859/m.31067 type:complete len:278 (+) Transcript_4859:2518-3351(+)